jgi:hypothetical protein
MASNLDLYELHFSLYEKSSLTEWVLFFEGITDNGYTYFEGINACPSRGTSLLSSKYYSSEWY